MTDGAAESEVSFYELSVLTWLIQRFGGVTGTTVPGFLSTLRMTTPALARLIDGAADLGFVQPSGEAWALTSAGSALAQEMDAAMQETLLAARKPYRRYFDYLPSDKRRRGSRRTSSES